MTREDLVEALAAVDAQPACKVHGRAKLVFCTKGFCGAIDCYGCDPALLRCRCVDLDGPLTPEKVEKIRRKVRESLRSPKT